MADLGRVTAAFELVSYLVVALGVPTGLYQYARAKAREREEHEARTFDAVSAGYVEFLRLCLEHPDLDVFDLPDERPPEPSPLRAKRELVALAILFSVFERAYLLHAGRPTKVTEGQWRGWDAHIRAYFRRANVRRAWALGEGSYDPRFTAYVLAVERRVGGADPPPGPCPSRRRPRR